MGEVRQQLVIHSGAFKTATSAVQTTLNKNANLLLREYGILIPHTLSRPLQGVDEEGARSHNQLGHEVHNFRRREEGAEEKLHADLAILANEVRASGAPRAVISTEMLTGIDEVGATAIRDALRAFDLRVVYSVRRVDEYVESLAGQELKFKNEINKLKPPYETPFSGVLSWANVLGDAAMDVLVYGYPSRRMAVTNTLRAMGIQDPARLVGDNPVRNPSLHADGILLRRALGRFVTEANQERAKAALRENIVRRAYRFEARLGRLKPLLVYGKAERLAIFDATLASHQEIAGRFLSTEQSEIFLARATIEAMEECEPARWEETEILSVVDELVDFALDHLRNVAPSGDAEVDRLQKVFRVARRRNARLRDRIKVLETRLGPDSPAEEGSG